MKVFDTSGAEMLVVEDLHLDYEADQRIEASREDPSIGHWELWDTLGLRASWVHHYEEIILDENSGRYSGREWDRPPNKWKDPWGWSYKHPELPEWRCRAEDHLGAVKVFKHAWAAAQTKGHLWNVKGKFGDGVVYKREKGARKLRRKGLPDA